MNLPQKKHIDMRHLRYFVQVAEELHFGRAAEMLGISQAPLSHQIKQLEQRIGVKLLDRTTRSVQLTAEGQVLLERSRKTLRRFERDIDAVRSVTGDSMGKLSIGSIFVSMFSLVPIACREFHRRKPDVRLNVNQAPTSEQLRLLETGKIDLALIRPPRIGREFKYEELSREGFVVVLQKDSPLSRRSTIEFEDLRDESWVFSVSKPGTSFQDAIFRNCKKAGFMPNVVLEVSDTLAVVVMVAAGFGIGIVPLWVTHVPIKGVVYKGIEKLPKAATLVAAWREENSNQFIGEFVKIAKLTGRLG